MAPEKKLTRGRQKVPMIRMEKDSNRQVTFSKRRSGLFKKASELCTLCGAEAAIIVFSPGRKAFSFGHPSVDRVINRFMITGPLLAHHNGVAQPFSMDAHRNNNAANYLCELNMQLTLLANRNEMEKQRGEELNEMRKDIGEDIFVWDAPIDNLVLPKLEHFKQSLGELKMDLMQHVRNLMMNVSASNINAPYVGFDPTHAYDVHGYGSGHHHPY